MDIKITIFTPTYNRAYILSKLYNSLCKQTCNNFEWLIIDDGSTDNTEKIVRKWINSDNKFIIRYFKQYNSGKCSAINYGLDLAHGQLFLVIDSDDEVTRDAIEKVINLEKSIKNKELYCGVSFNLGLTVNTTPNNIFEGTYKDGTLLDRYSELNGERAYAFYTEVHRKYKYPIINNEKFMTEAVAWNRIANDGYLMRFSNDIICVYEYQNDGLTNAGSSLLINNPHGYGLWLKEKDIFMNKSFSNKLKTYYSFTCELQDKYDDKIIAECIDIPVVLVKSLKLIHKFISLIRK